MTEAVKEEAKTDSPKVGGMGNTRAGAAEFVEEQTKEGNRDGDF